MLLCESSHEKNKGMGSRRFRDVECLVMKVLIRSSKKGILIPRVVGSFIILKNQGKIVCINEEEM